MGLGKAPSCATCPELSSHQPKACFSPAGCEPPGQSLPLRELSFHIDLCWTAEKDTRPLSYASLQALEAQGHGD